MVLRRLMDARVKSTPGCHGLCLSCRLLPGGMSTHMAAPLRRTGCTWSEVKSGLLWLGGWHSLEEFSDRAPMHQVCSDEPCEGDGTFYDLVGVVSQPQQQEGDQRDRDLDPDGVLGGPHEVVDFQGLLDPAKEQFDRPRRLYKSAIFCALAFRSLVKMRNILP